MPFITREPNVEQFMDYSMKRNVFIKLLYEEKK